jgi:outer membrane lipoprotein-sorting protein
MPTDNPNVISVQVRDPKRPEYGTMTMIFIRQASAPGGWTLNGWVALDSKNNRTTVRLDNVRYNMPIAQSSFTWRDPRPRRKS